MENMINTFNMANISPVLQLIILIVVTAIVAKVADWILSVMIQRLVLRTKTSLDNQLVEILHKPIYYSVFFLGLTFSLYTIDIPERVLFLFQGMFKSFTIIIWSVAIFKIFLRLIDWYSKQDNTQKFIQKRTIPLFDNVGKLAIFGAAVYFILLSWNVDVTGWVASAGILSVVFAAKDTLSNLFAGIFIMADAPYKEGDYINLDTGERGYVRSIGIRSTRIMTRDDIEITIPNSVIANAKIVNESGGPHERERIRITISVAYGSEIDKVRSLLMEIAHECENICNDPAPRVRFRQFGDYGLVFQLLFWIEKPEMRGRVTDEVNEQIYWKFAEGKIEIPYPHQVVQLKNPPIAE